MKFPKRNTIINKKLRLSTKKYFQKIGWKPRGFWYACYNSWYMWIKGEMPQWLHKYIYKRRNFMFLQLPLLLSMEAANPPTEEEIAAQEAENAEKRNWAEAVRGPLREINEKIAANRTTRLQRSAYTASGNKVNSLLAPNVDEAPNQLRITPYGEDKDQINRQKFIVGMLGNKGDKLPAKLTIKDENGNDVTVDKKNWKNEILNFITPAVPKSIKGGSMYFPAPELQTTYNFSWEQDQNKAVAKLAEIGSFTEAVKNVADGGGGGAIAGLVASMSKDNPDLISQTLYGNNRVAFNEPVQQYFKGIDVRTFSFTWKFIPKDKREWTTVQEIITRLNQYSHPEVMTGANSKFYRYPAEFGLEYLFYKDGKLKENKNLPRIGRCVCTNVDVNYSPNRLVTHDEGEPVEIDLSLSFTDNLKTISFEPLYF